MLLDLPTLPTAETPKHEPAPRVERPRRELLTPLPEPGHFLLVVDNSAAENFVCPTLASYYLFYNREGHARDASLTFGGAIHVGLEHIEKDEGKTVTGFDTSTMSNSLWTDVDTAKAVTKFWTDNPAPEDVYRTLPHAIEVLAHYRERKKLPDYQWEVLHDSEGPIIERAFELPLGTLEVNALIQLPSWSTALFVKVIHVAWAGRVDIGAFCNSRNRVVDNKTTSMGGDNFVQDFRLSSQSRGYIWAAQQLWPEQDVSGFGLNAIFLKKPAAGCGLMDKGPRGGAPALDFFRAYFDYSQDSITQWAENALVRVEDFVHCIVRGFFPMETTYCFNRKYGKCNYHDVCCMEDPKVRQNFLMSDAFKEVTWNPTAKK